MRDRTFARFRPGERLRTMTPMDAFAMVVFAISALALLEVAAANLRGEERHRRVRRSPRSTR